MLKISARKMEHQIHIQIEDNGNGITQGKLDELNDEQRDMTGHLYNKCEKAVEIILW